MRIREIAMAIQAPGGMQAVNLRVAEQYLGEFGKLAKTNNTMIIPTDLADISGVVGSITSVMNRMKEEQAFNLPVSGNSKP